jgi:hypothetical protein
VFAANFEMFSAINALSTFFFCFHSVVQIEWLLLLTFKFIDSFLGPFYSAVESK